MIRRRFFTLRWRIRHRLQHIKLAFGYAAGTLSADQAQDIIADCEDVCGRFSLMTLSTRDVMDMAIGEYGDAALDLARYLPAACARVAGKWESYGDEYWHAKDWALQIARDSAAQDGIKLEDAQDISNPSHEGESVHA
jgi:hypothetical protein